MAFRCCRAVISGLASDLSFSLWDRPQRKYVVRAAKHRLGHHCHHGVRISVLFADSDGMFDISCLSVSDADIYSVAHSVARVAQEQTFTPDL